MLRPLITAALLALAPVVASAASKPNIIFIMADDLGPEWISCYGAEDIETPNIDKLAAAGMKFENAYVMPQCTPTRATLLTGQYPFRHGWVNHWDVPRWGAGCHFDPKHNYTFSRLLKDAGYATAVAGKWQINDFRVQPNILRDFGFDEWTMWTGFETGVPASAERYWDPYVFSHLHPSRTYKGRFGPDVYNDFVLDFLSRHKDEPMLVYYPMALTHTPFVTTPHEPFAETNMERHKAMVRYTDYLTGRVVKQVDDLGLREKTIIIFTTDNGTAGSITGRISGRAVGGGKAKLTENGPWAPYIVRGPGLVPQGVTTSALTDLTDLLPTFAELAGVQPPADLVIDGKSIAPLLLGKAHDGPRDWMLAMGFGPARLDAQGVRPVKDYNDRVIRDKRYKIHVLDGKVARLHDLKLDPDEENNLIASRDPAHRAALERLSGVVEQLPKTDGRPRYDPLPPQPWDRTVEDAERGPRR